MTESSGTISLAPGVHISSALVEFSFASSSGPGGQNVNKRATKAELRIALVDIPIAGDARARLVTLAGRRLTDEGVLLISSDEHRTQARNKAEVLARVRDLIVRAMVRPRKRRPTRPTRGSVERRLESKRQIGERKKGRRAEE